MLDTFLNKLFDRNTNKWSSLSNKDKEGFFIVTNRMMSIQNPLLANELNGFYINKHKAIDWWHEIMSRQYFKVPGWVWTKTKFKEENKQKQITLDDYDEEIIKKYIDYNKISMKQLKECYSLFEKETIIELDKFKSFLIAVNKK